MQYLGGKAKISKAIVSFLESQRKQGQLFVEPFLGGCNILPLLRDPKMGSDINEDVVMFYQALQRGWTPPTSVSEEEYKVLKNLSEPSALRGFVGIACSYSGKWFGGYARSGKRNYAKNGYNTAIRTKPLIEKAIIIHSDYKSLKIPPGSLVYCDPPYKGVTGYGNFDHGNFWDWVRNLSKNNCVFVSEYEAPMDFDEVFSIERRVEMKSSIKKIEKIFKHHTNHE